MPYDPLDADPFVGFLDKDYTAGGRRLNRYRLIRLLGAGGFGAVYGGIDETLQRAVAVKLLYPQLKINDPLIVRRFLTEAQHAARIDHPNVVKIYDVGEYRETHYMVMELIDGASVADILTILDPIPAHAALHLIEQAARGLDAAHECDIIHRDVKPDNIIITSDGMVKVADLGLAKDIGHTGENLTETGMVVGTPRFASPEQILGKTLDSRTDVYSLGATAYRLMTGRPPFNAPMIIDLIRRITTTRPPAAHDVNPDVPDAISELIADMMNPNTTKRVRTLRAVIERIGALRAAAHNRLDAPDAGFWAQVVRRAMAEREQRVESRRQMTLLPIDMIRPKTLVTDFQDEHPVTLLEPAPQHPHAGARPVDSYGTTQLRNHSDAGASKVNAQHVSKRSPPSRRALTSVLTAILFLTSAIAVWQWLGYPAKDVNAANVRNAPVSLPASTGMSPRARVNAPDALPAVMIPSRITVLGVTAVRIPGGAFVPGLSASGLNALPPAIAPFRRYLETEIDASAPRRAVRVDDCYMGETEVSVGQYRAFLDSVDGQDASELVPGVWCESDEDAMPVRGVTFEQAIAYAGWLNTAFRSRYPHLASAGYAVTLPDPMTWERAARLDADGTVCRLMPSYAFDGDRVRIRTAEACANRLFTYRSYNFWLLRARAGLGSKNGHPLLPAPEPVYAGPAGYRGLRNMCGNVREWILSKTGAQRRGGAFDLPAVLAIPARKSELNSHDAAGANQGFRIAVMKRDAK